ncbi:response regulator [Chitinophaga sp. 212800010-3]|uniref:sensor histidine kinase n=1 Tax=unclassified Chitinophaga TaxID=2619133 RepID=UPI002DEDF2C7|nr:Hybrid sensor histidine kinase/response regulator [Chitinophaga sp. 212800010-3]
MKPQRKTFTILLVDDKPENLVSLKHMLEGENREILTATSGNDALKISLRHNDIGLIMLDVQMPDMDGYEVAKLLQSNPRTKDISIIFVTAINKEEQYVIKGFEEGAVDYLSKPLDINITRAKVNVFEKLYLSQQELKAAMVEKVQINKQLERFMYVVAHDLKSPLSGAISLLTMINEDERIQEAPDLKEYMSIALGAINHLTQMIAAIMDYTRHSDAEQVVETVNVTELIRHLTEVLFPPANIRIVTNGKLPVLATNRLKLQQVFQNLVSNAIKYNDKAEGLITIGGTDKDEFFEFYVKDNGPGVEKRDTDRIFRLFERLDNDGKEEGTGIGLNIFKLLVEEQGGKVWVDSVPGEGSTFYFLWRQHY